MTVAVVDGVTVGWAGAGVTEGALCAAEVNSTVMYTSSVLSRSMFSTPLSGRAGRVRHTERARGVGQILQQNNERRLPFLPVPCGKGRKGRLHRRGRDGNPENHQALRAETSMNFSNSGRMPMPSG